MYDFKFRISVNQFGDTWKHNKATSRIRGCGTWVMKRGGGGGNENIFIRFLYLKSAHSLWRSGVLKKKKKSYCRQNFAEGLLPILCETC